MKARDKISAVFLFHDSLEVARNPSNGSLSGKSHSGRAEVLLASNFDLICFHNILRAREGNWHDSNRFQMLTSMIMTSADWKRVGLADGSGIDVLDWNGWNSPLISRPEAKLLLNRTWGLSEMETSSKL